MDDVLNIKPFSRPVCARVRLPGSKSVTNRALVLAALSGGETLLSGALFSRDTVIMADCLKRLGYSVDADRTKGEIRVSSRRGAVPNAKAELFVGNAGTAARFLTALVCLRRGGEYFFDSDEAMYSRPMAGLIEALRGQGAEFKFVRSQDCFPFHIKTEGLKGGAVPIDACASSQMLSALMMVSPFANERAVIIPSGPAPSGPFLEMTAEMMRQFGFSVMKEDGAYCVEAAPEISGRAEYKIEPDATAASYFAALCSLCGGAALIEDFSDIRLQGDYAFVGLLESCGLLRARKVGADLLLRGAGSFAENAPSEFDFSEISDTFLTFAAACAALKRPVKIGGIAHTRRQETDRISAMAIQLRKLCRDVIETEDSIEIFPAEDLAALLGDGDLPEKIATYEDHRIAMSFGALGSFDALGDAREWLAIENPSCCGKTWPEFFGELERVRQSSLNFRVVAIDGGAAVGKSSVSKEASAALGYMHVDTGSHYRTISYALLEAGVRADDERGAAERLGGLSLGTALVGNSARMSVNGELVEDSLIRTGRVNESVSLFASMPCVRDFLKGYQRGLREYAAAENFGGLIMEGRDIGSVIFPDADLRIFLDADEATRQKRRAGEGIADSIAARDAIDKSRKTAPLVRPEGARLIDTSNMTKDEVVAETISQICSLA